MTSDNDLVDKVSVKSLISKIYPVTKRVSVLMGVQPSVIVVLVVNILNKSLGFWGKVATANLDSKEGYESPFEFVEIK